MLLQIFDAPLRLKRDVAEDPHAPAPTAAPSGAPNSKPPNAFLNIAGRALRFRALQDIPNFALRWQASNGKVRALLKDLPPSPTPPPLSPRASPASLSVTQVRALLKGLVCALNDHIADYLDSDEYPPAPTSAGPAAATASGAVAAGGAGEAASDPFEHWTWDRERRTVDPDGALPGLSLDSPAPPPNLSRYLLTHAPSSTFFPRHRRVRVCGHAGARALPAQVSRLPGRGTHAHHRPQGAARSRSPFPLSPPPLSPSPLPRLSPSPGRGPHAHRRPQGALTPLYPFSLSRLSPSPLSPSPLSPSPLSLTSLSLLSVRSTSTAWPPSSASPWSPH